MPTSKAWLWWCSAIACAAAVWGIVVYAVVPRLIRSAYVGESLPVFNSLISSQALKSVDYYLTTWREFANRGSVAVGLVAIAAAALLHPAVRNGRTVKWAFVLTIIAAIVIAVGPRTWDVLLRRAGLSDPPTPEEKAQAYVQAYEHERFPDADRNEIGDGRPANEIYLQHPNGLAEDAEGRVYIADRGHVIWRVDPDGRAHVIGGTGRAGSSTESSSARLSDLGIPEGLCLDSAGNIYFADSRNDKVMRIETDGRLVRIAGTGERGNAGDGGPARDAKLNRPFDVRVDELGVLYIADFGNNRVRAVYPDGIIRAYAGTGTAGRSGDGGPAKSAQLRDAYGLFLDTSGRLFITDSANNVVRRIDSQGYIVTIAGLGEAGYTGDGGPARDARFNSPQGGATDTGGRLFINDEHNHAIRVIEPDGVIRTLAGIGRAGRTPDGAEATNAALADPEAILPRADGSIIISEGVPQRMCRRLPGWHENVNVCAGLVRRISPDGILNTFAGKVSLAAWSVAAP